MTDEIVPYGYDEGKAAFMAEFEQLRPDIMYSDIWDESQQAVAAELLRPTRVKMGMLSSIPMNCRASECAFAPSCPLLKEGLAPLNKPCPIEMSFVKQFFEDYVDELNVDVSRMVEVSLVRDLVDQEIQQIRKTWILRQEHFIQENVAGVDSDGNVITKKELHQAVDYEDRILKRKEKLRNALLATREAKAKSGQVQVDSAQAIASLMHDVRQVEIEREKMLRLRLGIENVDDYIEADDAEVVEEGDKE